MGYRVRALVNVTSSDRQNSDRTERWDSAIISGSVPHGQSPTNIDRNVLDQCEGSSTGTTGDSSAGNVRTIVNNEYSAETEDSRCSLDWGNTGWSCIGPMWHRKENDAICEPQARQMFACNASNAKSKGPKWSTPIKRNSLAFMGQRTRKPAPGLES